MTHPTNPDETNPDRTSSTNPDGAAPDNTGSASTGGSGPADPAASDRGARPGGARRHGETFELGRALRALAGDLSTLRDELHDDLDRVRSEARNRADDLRSEVNERIRHRVRDGLNNTVNELAELMPRVADLEDGLVRLRAAVNRGTTTSAPGAAPQVDEPDPATDPTATVPPPSAVPPGATPPVGAATADDPVDAPVVTPAVGWELMTRGDAEAAWRALGDFVEHVLYRGYRMTRLQVPDCWPLHPRLIRELAWLRSTWLEAADLESQAAEASMPWHIRCIPGYLINAAEAVDVRECRPGVHRLTEAEIATFTVRTQSSRREGAPAPMLTTETGVDAPHLVPEHYPQRVTRSTVGSRAGDEGPKPPLVDELADLLPGPCHPRYWRAHHRAATAADLVARH